MLLHYSWVLPVACLMGGLHAHVIILPCHLQKAIFCPGTFRHNVPIAACCEITVKLLIMTKGLLLTWCGTLVKRVCVVHWWLVRLARKSRVGLGCKWKLFETSVPDMRHHSQARKQLCASSPMLVSICSFGTVLYTVTQLPVLNLDNKKEIPLSARISEQMFHNQNNQSLDML